MTSLTTPLITSLMDTDLYKLTMLQTAIHQFPSAKTTYAFKCRNTPLIPLGELYEQLNAQLDMLCELRFTAEELAWLSTLRFMKPDFIDWLENFQLKRRYIKVTKNDYAAPQDQLTIEFEGPMVQVMMFEIYVLSLVNELHFRAATAGNEAEVQAEGQRRLMEKIETVKNSPIAQEGLDTEFPFVFFEFGTRRRFSKSWQEHVVKTLKEQVPEYMKGTSNLDLARRFNLTPIGTMAHEYLQAHQALGYRLRDFQKMALENWVKEYRGDLGIALTDVVGMDAFLVDFDNYFAKLYDGIRHDSGNPYEWGEKALNHYKKLRVDARTKQFVFSDGLNVNKALDLYNTFKGRAKTGFGIGTNLTNDLGLPPLEIVAKMIRCNDSSVAKLSDSPGKAMCKDEQFMGYLREVFAPAK